ncbi:MAG: hypothetical protein L0Y39_11040 [Methylococcaceae bacterium]|nr:hypothetical protein [Methylococcaceae bacterium]
MPVQNCRPLKIVSSKYCAVWQCPDCCSIRLQLGDLTLQLTRQQLHGIAHGLNQAVLHLAARQAEKPGARNDTLLPH